MAHSPLSHETRPTNRPTTTPKGNPPASATSTLFNLDAARKELEQKSIEDIERATALTWGGRAAACFQFACDAADADDCRRWLMDGENYRQEAIEHAAMTGDLEFVAQVVAALDADRDDAMAAVRAT